MSEIHELAHAVKVIREDKGFHTPATIHGPDGDVMLGKLMLVVSEIGEAAEAVRTGDEENFAEELADTTIRILDICATCGIDLGDEIRKKAAVNAKRPPGHGKLTTL